MAFTRTNSGLQNLHLFHNVDFVVYCEGGTSYSFEDVKGGCFSVESIDSIFWSEIFNHYKDSSVKFKPIGSKSTVKKIAEEITENNLSSVYAAMDQEFDMVYNTNLTHPNILYTHGYSWENDVWNVNVICDIIDTLSAKKVDKHMISNHFSKFLKDIKYLVSSDGFLFSKNDSFFPRKGHMKLVNCNVSAPPLLKKEAVDEIKSSKPLNKGTVYAFGRSKNICAKRNCYGHILGDYCKQLIHYILKGVYNLNGIKDEFIRRMAIRFFYKNISDDINLHYQNTLI
jgi:hypothetical protein